MVRAESLGQLVSNKALNLNFDSIRSKGMKEVD